MSYLIRVLAGNHFTRSEKICTGETFQSDWAWHKQFPGKYELVTERNTPGEDFSGQDSQAPVEEDVRRLNDRYIAVKKSTETRWRVVDEQTGEPVNDKTYNIPQAKNLVEKIMALEEEEEDVDIDSD